jgi:hypothetical protein
MPARLARKGRADSPAPRAASAPSLRASLCFSLPGSQRGGRHPLNVGFKGYVLKRLAQGETDINVLIRQTRIEFPGFESALITSGESGVNGARLQP